MNYKRKLRFEQLEKRELLCAASDVLNIINNINYEQDYNHFLDSNKDGIISPIDALIVINKINYDKANIFTTPGIIVGREYIGNNELLNVTLGNKESCLKNAFAQVLITGRSDNIIIKVGEKIYEPISTFYIREISSWNFDISYYPGQRISVYGDMELNQKISLMLGGR